MPASLKRRPEHKFQLRQYAAALLLAESQTVHDSIGEVLTCSGFRSAADETLLVDQPKALQQIDCCWSALASCGPKHGHRSGLAALYKAASTAVYYARKNGLSDLTIAPLQTLIGATDDEAARNVAESVTAARFSSEPQAFSPAPYCVRAGLQGQP